MVWYLIQLQKHRKETFASFSRCFYSSKQDLASTPSPTLFSAMSYRRDNRSSRSSLLDGIDSLEEGGLKASSSYSREINEHDNDQAIESLHDRVSFLKRLTGDIHEEVESHNSMLDQVGNKMDASRGMMFGTMDRFKKVFEKKSTRKTCSLVGYFIAAFIFIYYLISKILWCCAVKCLNDYWHEDGSKVTCDHQKLLHI